MWHKKNGNIKFAFDNGKIHESSTDINLHMAILAYREWIRLPNSSNSMANFVQNSTDQKSQHVVPDLAHWQVNTWHLEICIQ